MKINLKTNFFKILLNILLISLGIALIVFILTSIDNILTSGKNMLTVETWINFVICSLYFLIVYNLRKIVYSIDMLPFCFDNVKRFKAIGYYIFFIAIFDAILNFKMPSNLVILATKYGSLKGSFFIYIVLSCLSFALAEIFRKAIKIKEENDLTI